jgi:peptidoglycan hydrolase CwlO-like protein
MEPIPPHRCITGGYGAAGVHMKRGDIMGRRSLVLVVAVLIVTAVLTSSVGAKTFISEHNLPAETTAGQPFEVTFTIEDHGDTISASTPMVVTARKLASDDILKFDARSQGDASHWTATVTLPGEGTWALAVEATEIGFLQDLPSVHALPDPAAPVTRAQLDAAITSATEGLTKQVQSLNAEIDGLHKQISSLNTERDLLQKQVAGLQATPPVEASGSGPSWWLVAAVGAVAGAVVTAGGYVVTSRRWFATRSEPVAATG